MKKQSILVLTLIFSCAVASLLFLGSCEEQYKTNSAEIVPGDQPAYTVPEDKTQQWENRQTMVKREHDVCIEHCGNDVNCLEKCKKAFKSRLDREYQKLIHD